MVAFHAGRRVSRSNKCAMTSGREVIIVVRPPLRVSVVSVEAGSCSRCLRQQQVDGMPIRVAEGEIEDVDILAHMLLRRGAG